MPISSEIQSLIDRLNQELDETEEEATAGLNLVRPLLSRFPENDIMVQFFAYLSTVIFFVVDSRRQIQATEARLSPPNVPADIIQDAGEDLGNLLGRIVEAKIGVGRIITRLENLP